MSNVVPLFGDKKARSSADSESRALVPVAKIAASIAGLTTALQKLSAQLDEADGLLESLEESDARKQMMHAQTIARESLIRGMNELSQAIKKLALRNDNCCGA
jgi:hypothetical protein